MREGSGWEDGVEGIDAMTFKGFGPGKQLDLSTDRFLTTFNVSLRGKKRDCLKMSPGNFRLPGQLILWDQRLLHLPAGGAALKFSFQWDLAGGFLSQVGGLLLNPTSYDPQGLQVLDS